MLYEKSAQRLSGGTSRFAVEQNAEYNSNKSPAGKYCVGKWQ
jgi:hypothetical protein